MTLEDVVANLGSFDNEHSIYATRIKGQWRAGSIAFVMREPEDGKLMQLLSGGEAEYLLEISLAKEIIEVWKHWRPHAEQTIADKLEAIVYYAENDAYLPLRDEIGTMQAPGNNSKT